MAGAAIAYTASMTSSMRRVAVVFVGSVMLAVFAGSAHAQPAPTERRARLVDVGVRPLVSFPDALGLTAEVHPFGGNLALEEGQGCHPTSPSPGRWP